MPLSLDEPVLSKESAASHLPRGLARTLFSFPVVIGMLLIVLTVFTVRSRFNDPDMWWHLKTGEIIWTTHSIPKVDLFSFTTSQHAYTPHEWLAQLTIYAAYHFGGYSGLMLWLCVFSSLIPIAGYILCWIYSGNGKIAFLGAMGVWFFSTFGLSIRPQLVGYLFLLAELIVVSLGRSRNPRWFFALPPLFAIWVNIHGSFELGLVVLGVVLACAWRDFRFGLLVARCWDKTSRRILAAAFALSIAALFINPGGVNQLTYPLNTLVRGSQPIGLSYSSEWQPAPMSDGRVWALFGCTAILLLVPLLRRIRLEIEELILLGVAFSLAVQHERMFFVFGILTMPILCRLLANEWDNYDPKRDSVVANLVMVLLAAPAIALGFPGPQNLAEQIKQGNPVNALAFIQQSGLSGRMLNDYVYGGYLIWGAPDHKVFVDGRGDVYEWTGVLKDYVDLTTLAADPATILAKYRIDFCLLSNQEPVIRALRLLPGWRTVYSDSGSTIFANQQKDQKQSGSQ